MDFSLPRESEEFAATVSSWAIKAAEESPDLWHHGAALSELGVFDLLGPEALDPENQHLNASLVLQAVAKAGMRGPLAETMWAQAGRGDEAPLADRWTGAPVAVHADGRSLVPYGNCVAWLIGPGGRLVAADGLEPAYTPMTSEAAWAPAGHSVPLEEADEGFAWLAHASLTLGYCERLLELALLQTRDRRAFGTELLTFQAPRFALVEVFQLISGLQLAVRDAAWRLDRGQAGATALAASAWVLAADVGRRVATHTHQVMGAASFPRETGVTPVTGALAVLRLGNGTDAAAREVWASWSAAAPDRPANISGVFAAADTSAPTPLQNAR